ncbi:MAG: hypothetical protein A3B24_00355 [Candidatus Wildermuthbacteria bacterium RIFCSPLOWO2_01_FULL_48_16]|uniref:DUF8128 domain-containing protein n=1 Tax=Candidatus Wildermuthbacteria bacterium RIFCSPLOWO2_01_FULL_48_16 TaxID=1802461 RepID=A0A1G2RLD3_9BACT|nr:MAG: hypothetical protein A3J57_01405 [Candidatus Wildermuthbacteria bacterium RIFCSPHIGHO2_02_FULL_49_12b]OHA73627.1 MAG: hypothetical protein A3B24_00355 [Candidatus Wildermuthbacteria bacterium RIFCSPLOWO2_01_FULL_48_16]
METFLPLFLSIAQSALKFLWEFVLTWWWLFLPVMLLGLFKHFWLWWRIDKFLSEKRWQVLEIRVPGEIDNPFRRMESVFAGIWQIKIGKNKKEKWFEGKIQIGMSCDIVSIEGRVHFYVRFEQDDRSLIETSIYAQFPNAEITEVEDYAKQLPADIPNKEWDFWASSYKLNRPDPYPIKTYKLFFEEQAGTAEDEPKRVDPLGQLLEGMAKLGPGEQMWVQIMISPVDDEAPHVKEGEGIVAKVVRRPDKTKQKGALEDVGAVMGALATGQAPAEAAPEKEELLPPEMRITPGERVVVAAIEEKIGKMAFACDIRSAYIAKRDVFSGAMKAIPMSYFNQFSTINLNAISVRSATWTKVKTIFSWFLDERRLYLRKRRHYRYYRWRFGDYFPRSMGTFALNIEELASIFHFPGRLTAPSAALPRVEAKKGEAPSVLPTE